MNICGWGGGGGEGDLHLHRLKFLINYDFEE